MLFHNFAFISYSHCDMAVAKWLQRRLEGFRLPTEVYNDIEAGTRYLRPVFRDQSDLNTGILSDELRKHLEESKFLIIICSKNSARSQWVSDEAQAFVEMGRLDRIIPVMIPDRDIPEPELFPIYLREYFAENPKQELLGINIGEVGRAKALIRVVSRMLDVSFDSLWKRHLRQRRTKIVSLSIASVIATAAVYVFAIPVSVFVKVIPEQSNLPVGEAVSLVVNGGRYVASGDAPEFEGIRLAGYNRFRNIDIKVSSQFFHIADTLVPTGFGIRRSIDVELCRDDTFAVFAGVVFDAEMNPLEGVTAEVAGFTSVTNSDGRFSIALPLAEQNPVQQITLEMPGYETVIREDETPGSNLRFIMHRIK